MASPIARSPDPDEECIAKSFEPGKPQGACLGDGHYLCASCIHYRADFLDPAVKQDVLEREHSTSGLRVYYYVPAK